MRGVDWPLFAILGAARYGDLAWVVLVLQNPGPRAGPASAWLAIGLRGLRGVPQDASSRELLRETVKAPPAFGPALALEYRRILVPIVPGQASDEATDVACRLAAERGSRIIALSVLEVPLDRPLGDDLPELARMANRELDEAVAIGESYGIPVLSRLERARSAGRAIVAEAEARQAEIIVLGSPRRELTSRRAQVFGTTVDYVLKHASCRTLVVASETA